MIIFYDNGFTITRPECSAHHDEIMEQMTMDIAGGGINE